MECKCPNCKGDVAAHLIGNGEERIFCETCGWFLINEAGECEPCDAPNQPSDDAGGDEPVISVQTDPPVPKPITSSSEKPNGAGAPPAPAGDTDEEEGLEVTFTDEVDY